MNSEKASSPSREPNWSPELAKLRNIHRLGEDFATAVKEKQTDLAEAASRREFDLEQKKIALTEAEVSLRRLQDKYNELKADREMASFKAPENGILLYGRLRGGQMGWPSPWRKSSSPAASWKPLTR